MQDQCSVSPGRVVCVCLQCGKQFTRWRAEALQGRDKTCSRECAAAHNTKTRPSCAHCGAVLKRLDRRYCGRACKFWARVDNSGPIVRLELGPCWLWTGGKTAGYGDITMKGLDRYTHRISWILTNGPIPEGLWVRHKCDNPTCVNPAHLELGDAQENAGDRERRGRHPRHKASAEQVRLVFSAKGQAPARVIAERYGLREAYVYRIWEGKGGRWALQE